MRDRQNELLSVLKWPALAAALVAGALALLPALNTMTPTPPSEPEVTVASRDAMRILRDGHDKVLDQIDRQRAESEQKAAEEAHAFEQARLAAAEEAARKLAEQRAAEQRAAEQRAAEAKRVADASAARDVRTPKPKPEPVAAGAPLDIVPASGGEGGSLPQKPRGPIETVVATVGDVADEIKNKTVSTVVGIKDWFSAAGDKLLGRDKPVPAAPASHLSSTF